MAKSDPLFDCQNTYLHIYVLLYLHWISNTNTHIMTEDTTKEKISWKKRILRISIGLSAGALLGYAYYYFIGCNTGSCPITSNPWNSVFYGMLLGGIWTIK
jgi:hypothetical protein